MNSESPVAKLKRGDKIEIEWPLKNDQLETFFATVESVNKAKEKNGSSFKYEILFDDGDKITSRLIDVKYKILETEKKRKLVSSTNSTNKRDKKRRKFSTVDEVGVGALYSAGEEVSLELRTNRIASRTFFSRDDFKATSDEKMIAFVKAVRGPIKEVELLASVVVNSEKVRDDLFQSDRFVHLKIRENVDNTGEDSTVNLYSVDKSTWSCEWDEGSSILDAWILPNGVEWPTLRKDLTSKQENIVGRQVLFSRTATHCAGRDEETIKDLRKGEKIAWVGLPGIGKTAALNNILFRFIRNLGEEGWPKNVILKVGSTVFWVSQSKDRNIEIKEASYESSKQFDLFTKNTLRGLDKFGGKESDYAVFVELMEDENDPNMFLPYLVTSSSREVDAVTLKTHYKSGLPMLLCDPLSWPELFLMREVLALSYKQDPGKKEGDFISATELLDGFNEIGGIPRILLGFNAVESIIERKNDILSRIENFFKLLPEMSVYNIPSYMKFYAAPYVNKGTKNPKTAYNIYSFHFLSNKIAALIGSKTKLPEQYLALKNYGLSYQAFESLCLHAIFLSRDPEYSNFPVEQTFKAMTMKEVPIVEKHQAEITVETLKNRAGRLSEAVKELFKLLTPLASMKNNDSALKKLQKWEKALLDKIIELQTSITSFESSSSKEADEMNSSEEDLKLLKGELQKEVNELGSYYLKQKKMEDKKRKDKKSEDKKSEDIKSITTSLKKKIETFLDSKISRNDKLPDDFMRSDEIKDRFITGVGNCTNVIYFNTQYLKERVESLSGISVYQCALVNGVVYDFLVVNHETKTVYMFQVTDKSTIDHATKAVNMLQVMKNLGIFEGKGKDYNIVYIFITSAVEPKNEKLIFSRGDMNESDYELIRNRITSGFILRF